MKIERYAVGLFAPLLFLAFPSVQADPVLFTTGAKLSDDSTAAAFSGSIELTAADANGGTLVISLTNNSEALNGGYITALAFNNPGPISPLDVSLVTSSGLDSVLGGSIFINEVDAPPVSPFDIGAAVGNSWLAGGSPSSGIGVGETATFTFTLTGNLFGLTTQSFIDTLNAEDGEWLALRFRGFVDGGSSKYGATVVPLPAAAWLFVSALLGLAGIGYRRRMTGA
jgi:hypothetical protein